ncbi:MAG: DNA-directed RNA polymerase subunit H [Candidatus Bathyarchaeia archaeon]
MGVHFLVKKIEGVETKGFSVFNHELVPKHVILKQEEVEELLHKHRIKPHQLPYIKASDPAVREIGANPGQIVKIIRKSPTAGDHVYYRLVIEG